MRFQNRATSIPPSAPESTAETTPNPSVANDVGSPGVKSEISICVDGNRFRAPANQQRTKKLVVDNAPVSAARPIASLDWDMADVLVGTCAWASVMAFLSNRVFRCVFTAWALRFSFGPRSRVKPNYWRVSQPGCACGSTTKNRQYFEQKWFGGGERFPWSGHTPAPCPCAARPEGQGVMRIQGASAAHSVYGPALMPLRMEIEPVIVLNCAGSSICTKPACAISGTSTPSALG